MANDSSEPGSGAADPHLGRRYKVERPGWDLRLDLFDEDGCVQSLGTYSHLLALREISMMSLVNAITDKPDWDRKIFDEAIVDKWRTEVLESPSNREKQHFDANTFDWCVQEIRAKAELYRESKLVNIFDVEYTAAKSDVLVSENLRKELCEATEQLLKASPTARDYHPNSNDQVLNLVHPSLYPLVYGKSRVLTTGPVPLQTCSAYIGKGEIIPHVVGFSKLDNSGKLVPNDRPDGHLYSSKYQWLPAEIRFNDDKTARIDSYVNNLHPEEHPTLYAVLANFVDAAIPLWNACLPLSSGCFNRDCDGLPRIHDCNEAKWDPPDEFHLPPFPPPSETGGDIQSVPEASVAGLHALADAQDQGQTATNMLAAPSDDHPLADGDSIDIAETDDEHDGSSDDEESSAEARWRRIRRIVHPEPRAFDDWPRAWPSEHDLRESCDEEGLQVIFKIASIELTPDKPSYPGGSWHVEGQSNEHIAATAIYYYDCENITESTLSFRTEFSQYRSNDLQYGQDDHEGLTLTLGVTRDSDCVQEIGSVVTRQARMLCFPNNFQHKVGPMRLVDPSRPGHRRFLVMWIVDPWNRVLSTANVPPQQRDWWVRELLKTDSMPLPPEIAKMVGDEVRGDFPITLDEAKEIRLDLMSERTAFVDQANSKIASINLCEH